MHDRTLPCRISAVFRTEPERRIYAAAGRFPKHSVVHPKGTAPVSGAVAGALASYFQESPGRHTTQWFCARLTHPARAPVASDRGGHGPPRQLHGPDPAARAAGGASWISVADRKRGFEGVLWYQDLSRVCPEYPQTTPARRGRGVAFGMLVENTQHPTPNIQHPVRQSRPKLPKATPGRRKKDE